MITPRRVDVLDAIERFIAEGWQVSAVWLVPPSSQLNKSRRCWEAHITRPDFPLDDEILELSPMSEEQAEAIAGSIQKAGDASAVHFTSSGCFAIGPTASWCCASLRRVIISARD